jgi:hypothetical protein
MHPFRAPPYIITLRTTHPFADPLNRAFALQRNSASAAAQFRVFGARSFGSATYGQTRDKIRIGENLLTAAPTILGPYPMRVPAIQLPSDSASVCGSSRASRCQMPRRKNGTVRQAAGANPRPTLARERSLQQDQRAFARCFFGSIATSIREWLLAMADWHREDLHSAQVRNVASAILLNPLSNAWSSCCR